MRTSPPRSRRPRRGPGMENQSGNDAGDHPADEHPNPEEAVDEAEYGIGHQIGDIAGQHVRIRCEQPADMRVPHPCEQPPQALAMKMGRMRIALPIAVLVMCAVHGTPLQHRTLGRHRPRNRQQTPQNRSGASAVREHAVKADRDAKNGERVESGEQRDCVQPTPFAP